MKSIRPLAQQVLTMLHPLHPALTALPHMQTNNMPSLLQAHKIRSDQDTCEMNGAFLTPEKQVGEESSLQEGRGLVEGQTRKCNGACLKESAGRIEEHYSSHFQNETQRCLDCCQLEQGSRSCSLVSSVRTLPRPAANICVHLRQTNCFLPSVEVAMTCGPSPILANSR